MSIEQQQFLRDMHLFVTSGFEYPPEHVSNYLHDRGLSYDYMKRAGCGYISEQGKSHLWEALNVKKQVGIAKQLGFITPSEHILSDALYFPLYDQEGVVKSFSVRLMPDSEFVKNGGSPHWTMSIPISYPVGCMYPKSGLDPYRGRATFICEGAIDAITLLQNGYNAIGLIGISNWKSHYIDFLNTTGIVIAFDCDKNKSGQKAAVKLARRLADAGMGDHVHILELPVGEDINSFYTDGFFGYSKRNLHLFYETKAGFDWLQAQEKKKGFKPTNQMSQKVIDAKAKPIVGVYRALGFKRQLYEFQRGVKTVCPFHQDTRGSLHLYDNNSFFCFGCQAGGDTIDLVRTARPDWDFNKEVLPFILGVST